jgi:hypothetical protein
VHNCGLIKMSQSYLKVLIVGWTKSEFYILGELIPYEWSMEFRQPFVTLQGDAF